MVLLTLPVRYFLQNLEAVDYPSLLVADVDMSVHEVFADYMHCATLLLGMALVCSSPVRTSSPVPLWVPPLPPAVTDYLHLKSSKNQC